MILKTRTVEVYDIRGLRGDQDSIKNWLFWKTIWLYSVHDWKLGWEWIQKWRINFFNWGKFKPLHSGPAIGPAPGVGGRQADSYKTCTVVWGKEHGPVKTKQVRGKHLQLFKRPTPLKESQGLCPGTRRMLLKKKMLVTKVQLVMV